MDATRDYYSKLIETKKDKYIWYHLYVESKIWHREFLGHSLVQWLGTGTFTAVAQVQTLVRD